MNATIDPALTQPMSLAEAKRSLAMVKIGMLFIERMQPDIGHRFLAKASSAELTEMLKWSATQVAATQAKLDAANHFRPSYAPAGRETRTQGFAASDASRAVRVHRLIAFVLAERTKQGK